MKNNVKSIQLPSYQNPMDICRQCLVENFGDTYVDNESDEEKTLKLISFILNKYFLKSSGLWSNNSILVIVPKKKTV